MGRITTIRQSTQAELQWFCAGLQYSPHTDIKGLTGLDRTGTVVAIVGFDGWTHGAVCLHSWISSGALTKEFCREVARYPASSGRKVLIGNTPASNAVALRFNKHYGFKETHRIKDGYASGVDLIVQELRLDNTCKWLGDSTRGRVDPRTDRSIQTESGNREPSQLRRHGVQDSTALETGPGSGIPDRAGCSERATAGHDQRCERTKDGDGRTSNGGSPESRLHPNGPALGCSAAVGTAASTASSTDSSSSTATAGSSTAERGGDGSRYANEGSPNVTRRWYSPGPTGPGDAPVIDEDVSLEPWCDIQAQIQDMERPDSARRAVWLSPRNWEAYRDRLYPQLKMRDFDGLGGCLIVRNMHIAYTAKRRADAGENVRAIVGELICAGRGKPEWTETACVAQFLSDTNAVMRESVQPDATAAAKKLAEWSADYPHAVGRIISIPDALKRRQDLVAA